MRIAHVITRMIIGGAQENTLLNCLDLIRDHGDEVMLITDGGKLVSAVETAIKEVTGLTTELSTSGGTSDARFIKNYCPVAEFGLMNETAHKVDERVAITDINALTEIYRQTLKTLFEAP